MSAKNGQNKTEALATYAKMAEDDFLRAMADKIQARAVRRMGEILKEIDGSTRNKDVFAPLGKEGSLRTQKEVAHSAGISEHQRKQAVRIANVSAEQFELAVETQKPATVTKLAEMGKQPRAAKTSSPVELDEFNHQSPPLMPDVRTFDERVDPILVYRAIKDMADAIGRLEPETVASGVSDGEVDQMIDKVRAARAWLNKFAAVLHDRASSSDVEISAETKPTSVNIGEMPDLPASLDRRGEPKMEAKASSLEASDVPRRP